MIETMELESLAYNKTTESGSEEYDEIKRETVLNSSSPHNISDKSIKENDFFTNFNNNDKHKKIISKKKKSKKKLKPKSFMDTISSELASKPLLIKNVISTRDYSNEQYSYLREGHRDSHVTKRNLDAEGGWSHDINMIDINPIFPSVLENVSRKDTSLSLKYIEPVMFFQLVSTCHGNEVPRKPRFLDININKLRFIYHHDFSLEILLGIKLENIFKEYQVNRKTLNDLLKDITVNRKTRNNLREHLINISPDKKDEIRFDITILKYTKIMLELKEKYYVALNVDKKLVHQILSLWADIETLRLKSRCITTPYNLEVTKQKVNDEEFNEKLMQIFEEEYSDMLIKVEYDFIVKYLKYKELKRSNIEKKDIVKPKLEFSSEKMKDAVDSIVSAIVTKQNVDINLRKNEKYIKKSFNQNTKHTYFFKVYVDNVFVCESDQYFITRNAHLIDLAETFSIQLLEKNKNVKITLFENDNKISSFRINVSEIKDSIVHVNSITQKFVYDKIIAPTSKYIGSGYDIKNIAAANNIRLKSSNLFNGKLFTTYEADIKVGWNEKTTSYEEQIISFINIRTCLKRLFLGTLKPTVDLLTDIISNIYDKSVANDTQIMNALKEVCREKVKIDNVFNKDESNQISARLKLLYLRNTGKLVDLENKSIPLLESQISTEQLNALTASEDLNLKTFNFGEKNDMDPIDLQRYLGVKYVMKLNKNLLAKIDDFLLQKTYKDVVRDFEDLSLRGLFNTKTSFNLGATSTLTKQQILRDCLKEEQEIRVTVMRAHNLLDRTRSSDSDDNQSSDDIAGFKMRPLRPFLRVCYHGETCQTPTAIGCHPTWNHTVVIKSKLEPLSCINIHIYDECRTNVVDSSSDQSYHYRRHTSWLGSIQIPLRAVLNTGILRGAFKITTPPYIFGYEVPNEIKSTSDIMQLLRTDTALIFLSITTSVSHLAAQSYNQPIIYSDRDDLLINHLNTFTTDYLNNFPSRNLSLTFIDSSGTNKCITEFLQPIPIPDDDCFPRDPKKAESSVSKGSGQSKSSSSKSSWKKSIDGEDVPPINRGMDSWAKGENQLRNTMDAAIRYVSLIPAYEVLETHAVTLMGVELLKLQYGSPLDHTILLASFFIYLGIKCYVITGWGLPRGVSSYVLVKFHHDRVVTANEEVKKGFWVKNDSTAWYIYDAVAGERFDLREIGCPLKKVSHVFDCDNIWVNVQTSQECGSVSLDLKNSSEWQPVFNKPMFLTKPIDSLYSPPDEVEGLRATLEIKIKNKIQKWRSHVKTIWNRYCSGLLRETLPYWEYWSFNPTHSRPSPGHRLKQLMVTYKMCGFPLNMSYVNPKFVTSRIKSTAIHVNDDPDVEFGLAVEVYAYPNNVLSVWVFLVSIVKIND